MQEQEPNDGAEKKSDGSDDYVPGDPLSPIAAGHHHSSPHVLTPDYATSAIETYIAVRKPLTQAFYRTHCAMAPRAFLAERVT